MKTNLPNGIGTIDQAKAFLTELHRNGESFHPEDDATDILWTCDEPTLAEQESLNALMHDIYHLPGNDGSHVNMVFDPCEFLLELDN